MSVPDMLDSFDMLPGGALMSRHIAYWWRNAEHYTQWAKELVQKEATKSQVWPLFPHEYVTPAERGDLLMYLGTVAVAAEQLQDIATNPATHTPLRRIAAHAARVWLSAWAELSARHQKALGTDPYFRSVCSGPLAVVWVSAGVVRWEVNQFETMERDGDLTLVVDLPNHLSTVDQLRVWTEAHCVNESASLTSVA